MLALKWKRRLEAAPSSEEVVAIANEFVATLSVFSLARLPEVFRPGPFESAREIQHFAARIVRHSGEEDGASRRLIHYMTDFFSAAAQSIAARADTKDPG